MISQQTHNPQLKSYPKNHRPVHISQNYTSHTAHNTPAKKTIIITRVQIPPITLRLTHHLPSTSKKKKFHLLERNALSH